VVRTLACTGLRVVRADWVMAIELGGVWPDRSALGVALGYVIAAAFIA